MADNKQKVRQHEPLRVPQGWTDQARSLVMQIERVFDRIFSLLGKKKEKQAAKDDPTASGTAISFIDSISQDENGEITATKKTVRSASATQSGVVTTGAQTIVGVKTFGNAVQCFQSPGTAPLFSIGETGRSLRCYFQIGSGSENHGIYSNGYYNASTDTFTSDTKWMIYRNSAGKVIVRGDCEGNAASASSVAWANVTGKPSSYTPSSHASSATTYGIGNASNYGHTKLTDTYGTIGASQKAANAVALSAWAGQTAYNKACNFVAGDTFGFQSVFFGKATNAKTGYFGCINLPKIMTGLTAKVSGLVQSGTWYSDGASHTLTLTGTITASSEASTGNSVWFTIPATNISSTASVCWIRLYGTITFS